MAVTRKKGELKTYVNGRLCSEIKLESTKLLDKSTHKPAGTARGAEEGADKEGAAKEGAAKEGMGGGGGKGGKDGAQHGASPPERFCIDPQHFALFAAREGAVLGATSSGGGSSGAFASSAATAGSAAAGVSTSLAQHGASLMSAALLSGGEDGGSERGLAVRYVKLVTSVWTEDQVCEELHSLRGKHEALHASAHHGALSPQVREELHSLRGKDEEAELLDEAEAARSQQLSLQPLYAKPPPVWLHPAFAAEVGDAFIVGTGLDGGSLHISLEVVVLTLQRLLAEPHGAACSLPHAQRAALNTTCALLEDAKKLAHKLAHAMGHQGQQRMYLSKVLE